jgi:hypothetical protein
MELEKNFKSSINEPFLDENSYKIITIPDFMPFKIPFSNIYEKDYFKDYIPLEFRKGKICIICDIGQFYFKNAILHRDNGPCIIYLNGNREWYQNGNYDMRLF